MTPREPPSGLVPRTSQADPTLETKLKIADDWQKAMTHVSPGAEMAKPPGARGWFSALRGAGSSRAAGHLLVADEDYFLLPTVDRAADDTSESRWAAEIVPWATILAEAFDTQLT